MMEITVEIPIWVDGVLIGDLPDVEVEVALSVNKKLERATLVNFGGMGELRLSPSDENDMGMRGIIWNLIVDELESGRYDHQIADYVADLRDAEREEMIERRWEEARDRDLTDERNRR
jgi:hypothetical protein